MNNCPKNTRANLPVQGIDGFQINKGCKKEEMVNSQERDVEDLEAHDSTGSAALFSAGISVTAASVPKLATARERGLAATS